MERRNVYKSVEERERGAQEEQCDPYMNIAASGGDITGSCGMLPVPVSADSQHLLDEPGPGGLHGSAWQSPP